MNGVVVRGSRRAVLTWLLAALCAMAQAGLQEAVSLARQGHYADARRALSGAAEPVDVRQKIAFHRLKAAIASGLKEAPAAADEMRAALKLSPADSQLLWELQSRSFRQVS
jgi:Tfp pilus assembly protein PilF